MSSFLDYIAVITGTTYLSDLRTNAELRKNILYIIEGVPENRFSLDEWTEAARYILNDYTVSPSTEEEARELFRKQLSE